MATTPPGSPGIRRDRPATAAIPMAAYGVVAYLLFLPMLVPHPHHRGRADPVDL
ncbi:hypothetical protein [Nocardia africana]|uniref:Uncharacterized protein n=1 Tax=Nocardia africana TaxID=134964 RepID=A0A378WWR9_9NOCA|nr:hypothetical protein [Nocardia africana]MCC3313033.1 hypothetical protein [Nocardia africana]SUA45619.1 Uncharacterised protein [Nocardia africana]